VVDPTIERCKVPAEGRTTRGGFFDRRRLQPRLGGVVFFERRARLWVTKDPVPSPGDDTAKRRPRCLLFWCIS
jgi:hypothetical protein